VQLFIVWYSLISLFDDIVCSSISVILVPRSHSITLLIMTVIRYILEICNVWPHYSWLIYYYSILTGSKWLAHGWRGSAMCGCSSNPWLGLQCGSVSLNHIYHGQINAMQCYSIDIVCYISIISFKSICLWYYSSHYLTVMTVSKLMTIVITLMMLMIFCWYIVIVLIFYWSVLVIISLQWNEMPSCNVRLCIVAKYNGLTVG